MPSASHLRLTLEALPKESAKVQVRELQIGYDFCETPLGRCLLAETEGRVCYLAFAPVGTDSEMLTDLSARWPGSVLSCQSRLLGQTVKAIFTQTQPADSSIKLLVQGTDFQIQVWRALLNIPYADLSTYAQVAQSVGRPEATRAVGTAIGANPIAWLIPCHRVVRSDGGLGGYRWGLDAKKACLDFEKQL